MGYKDYKASLNNDNKSSGSVGYKQYKTDLSIKAAQDWVSSCNTLLDDYNKYFEE